MITDQARNLRILAEQRGITKKQSLPPRKKVSLKSRRFFIAGGLIVILFLCFEYLDQQHMLKMMSEKNTVMEEKIILLSTQLENLANNIETSIEQNYLLQKEIKNIFEPQGNVLMQWKEREKQLNLVEKEIDAVQNELNILKSQQEEMDASFSQKLALSLDSLNEKVGGIMSGVEQMKAETNEKLKSLGIIISYEDNDKLAIIAHMIGSELKKGSYLAVHRGEQRVAILKVIEVREKVSACKVVELWAPLYKGDEVRRL